MLVIFAGCLVSRILIYLLYYIFWGSIADYNFFAVSVYSAVLAPVWFYLLGWAYKMEEKEIY